jgi:toxin-antitoxin system PIN domain toxin
MFLIDVNFCLALAFQSHVHHLAAKAWFDGVTGPQVCHFCRMTQQGFLRLATNPKAFGAEAVTLERAWELYDALLGDPRLQFMNEPTGIEVFWRDYTRAETFSPKVWNDAYLAAFARAANLQLVTFDNGFTQFTDLNRLILS